ncbi:cellobiose dehydrogenase [Rhypophila decipiens]
MGLFQLSAAVLALGTVVAASPIAEVEPRSVAAKVCDAATTVCYSEYTSPGGVSYRIAIPDTAKAGDFDVLLQIVAPQSVGWAGLAWGGVMVNNPLAVAWANGQSSVVTSRSAASRTYPTAYAGATYTVLPGSVSNTTHWTLNALVKGVSSFGTTKLNPNSTAVSLAYAQSASKPNTPADPNSRFGIHNSRGKWSHDFAAAKVADWATLVQKASASRTPA